MFSASKNTSPIKAEFLSKNVISFDFKYSECH